MKIIKFGIKGYRSLNNIEITNLDVINIFHGENNTGKSNILRAIELFFSEKFIFTSLTGKEEGDPVLKSEQKEISFQGKVPIKESDFFIYEKQSIIFKVEIELNQKDIVDIKKGILKQEIISMLNTKSTIIQIIAEIPFDYEIHDEIIYFDFTITSIRIGDNELISESSIYVELVDNIEKLLLGKFSNINSQRQIIKEIDDGTKQKKIGIKNVQKYLHDLNLSDKIEDRLIFNTITEKFNEINKNLGELTFSTIPSQPNKIIEQDERGVKSVTIKERNEIRLMLISPKDKILLPIENFGSGVHQSLLLLANVVANNNAKIYGIEELEANLSPHNQEIVYKNIMNMMNDSSFDINQLFITSHSNIFSKNKSNNANVYIIKKKDGKETILEEFNKIEYITFFWPYQVDYSYVEDNLRKLYSTNKIGLNDTINGEYAKDLIDRQIVEEIQKNNAWNDKKKIDEIFASYEKKIGKEIIIIKE